MESQSKKALLLNLIGVWNERLSSISYDQYKLEIIEKDYTNVGNVRMFEVTIKLVNKSQPLFKQVWWHYKTLKEETIEELYSTLLKDALFRGFNDTIQDWETGRLTAMGNEIIINPTTDEILNKAGYKLVKI